MSFLTCQRCGRALGPTFMGCPGCGYQLLAHEPEPEPEPPARVTGKVLGFRFWTLKGYKLMSVNAMFGGWEIGVNEAECKAPPGGYSYHDAPGHGCGCGLYAWHESYFQWLFNFLHADPLMPYVWGAVLAWGRIEVHPDGFRAQYAEPVMLAFHPDQDAEHIRRVQAIAGEMAVPVVRVEELADEAAKLGQPVAEELRPARFELSLPPPAFVPWGSTAKLAPPPPPAPTWIDRAPMMVSFACMVLEDVIWILSGDGIAFGFAVGWALFCVWQLVGYRRRFH